MATVNFNVPEDVRQEFNQLFSQENKSAILTKLMQQAIAEKKRQQRRQLAVDKILELRAPKHRFLLVKLNWQGLNCTCDLNYRNKLANKTKRERRIITART